MSRQIATPPSPVSRESCTEVRADAAPAISRDADQLITILRRLQSSTESGLQCWVIVNSTGGKSSHCKVRFRSIIEKYFSNNLFLFFPSLCSPAVVLPVCSSVLSSSPVLTCSTVFLPRLHGFLGTFPRSHGPCFLVRSLDTPTVPPSPQLRCFHGPSPRHPQ